MDELIAEIREANKSIKEEQSILDRRIRALEDERTRIRVLLIPVSIVVSALLSFGAQQLLTKPEGNSGTQTRSQP